MEPPETFAKLFNLLPTILKPGLFRLKNGTKTYQVVVTDAGYCLKVVVYGLPQLFELTFPYDRTRSQLTDLITGGTVALLNFFPAGSELVRCYRRVEFQGKTLVHHGTEVDGPSDEETEPPVEDGDDEDQMPATRMLDPEREPTLSPVDQLAEPVKSVPKKRRHEDKTDNVAKKRKPDPEREPTLSPVVQLAGPVKSVSKKRRHEDKTDNVAKKHKHDEPVELDAGDGAAPVDGAEPAEAMRKVPSILSGSLRNATGKLFVWLGCRDGRTFPFHFGVKALVSILREVNKDFSELLAAIGAKSPMDFCMSLSYRRNREEDKDLSNCIKKILKV